MVNKQRIEKYTHWFDPFNNLIAKLFTAPIFLKYSCEGIDLQVY